MCLSDFYGFSDVWLGFSLILFIFGHEVYKIRSADVAGTPFSASCMNFLERRSA